MPILGKSLVIGTIAWISGIKDRGFGQKWGGFPRFSQGNFSQIRAGLARKWILTLAILTFGPKSGQFGQAFFKDAFFIDLPSG
jgi:hypothetical protein